MAPVALGRWFRAGHTPSQSRSPYNTTFTPYILAPRDRHFPYFPPSTHILRIQEAFAEPSRLPVPNHIRTAEYTAVELPSTRFRTAHNHNCAVPIIAEIKSYCTFLISAAGARVSACKNAPVQTISSAFEACLNCHRRVNGEPAAPRPHVRRADRGTSVSSNQPP